MFNVTATGRLTASPTLQTTGNSVAFVKFSLATDRYAGKTEDGQAKTITDYVDVTVWGGIATTHADQLDKGHLVCVTGDLIQERWQSDGVNKSKHSIKATNVEYLSKPRSNSAPAETAEMANA